MFAQGGKPHLLTFFFVLKKFADEKEMTLENVHQVKNKAAFLSGICHRFRDRNDKKVKQDKKEISEVYFYFFGLYMEKENRRCCRLR